MATPRVMIVEDDQVGQLLVDADHRLFAIGAELDAVAFLLEIVVEEGGEGLFVLNHQNIRLN